MTLRPLRLRYDVHAVGQGLFATGLLQDVGNKRSFRWVYDCGTTSRQNLLLRRLDEFRADATQYDGSAHLNLVALSHFDSDHTSGLTTLLSQFSVDTLLLPYMPLWQRLLVAFGNGADAGSQLALFAVDPPGFLASLGADAAPLERIVFVPPSSGPSARADGTQNPADGDEPFDMLIDDADPPPGEERQDLEAMRANRAGRSVEFLQPGGRLRLGHTWEFVPYNDASFAPMADEEFIGAVAKRRRALLDASDAKTRLTALKDLREVYKKKFGIDGKASNGISLFLYGGPIFKPNVVEIAVLERGDPSRSGSPRVCCRESDRVSILYTGDGYLNNEDRLAELTRYLGSHRMKQIGLLQVMHHGARANWHPGLAAQLSPQFSVFSSDPHGRWRHPHAEVLRDFSPFNPVQVDRERGVRVESHFT